MHNLAFEPGEFFSKKHPSATVKVKSGLTVHDKAPNRIFDSQHKVPSGPTSTVVRLMAMKCILGLRRQPRQKKRPIRSKSKFHWFILDAPTSEQQSKHRKAIKYQKAFTRVYMFRREFTTFLAKTCSLHAYWVHITRTRTYIVEPS